MFSSHSQTCVEKVDEAFAPEWDAWIRGITQDFKTFHQKVLDMLAQQIPVYFFRYEDQTTDARATTVDLLRVMLDAPDIEGTVVMKRIDDVTQTSSTERSSVYKLKSTQTLNRNIGLYNQE